MYAGRAVERGPARAVLSSARASLYALPSARQSVDARRAARAYVMPDQMPSLRAAAGHVRLPLRAALSARDRGLPRASSRRPSRLPPATCAACIRAERHAGIATAQRAAAAPDDRRAAVLQVEESREDTMRSAAGCSAAARTVDRGQNASVSALRENEFVGVVGESGSGKSTSPSCWSGWKQPSSGRILLNGEDVTRRRRRGARAARRQLCRWCSRIRNRRSIRAAASPSIVTQAMEAGSRHAGWDERLRARPRELLAEVGLAADFAARLPGQLSGGQRQRVNIARALCNIPKLLVADEIVSGLDVSIQAQLLNLLARLRAELGFAMLFISHDLSVVRHLCSRVLVMYRGEIVEQGPIETVFANPQHPHTRALLSSVPPDEPDATWSLLQAN